MTRRLAVVALGAGLLAGCASKGPLILSYGKANYAWGRIEMAGELLCKPPVPVDRADFCAEAARFAATVYQAKPLIDAELVRGDLDVEKILPYVDLILGAVGKAALVP